MGDIVLPYKYTPRAYQKPFWDYSENGGKRYVGVWHRRAGKDRTVFARIQKAMYQRKGLYWHVLPDAEQGRKVIWNGTTFEGDRFIDFFPPSIVERSRDDRMMIETKNGSLYQVIGAVGSDGTAKHLRGPNPVGVVFSECAFFTNGSEAWDVVRPILNENGGWAVFISTPMGREWFHDIYERAKLLPNWKAELLTVDDTFRDDGTPVITQEAIDEDRANGYSEAKIQQEYYCFTPETKITTTDGLKAIHSIRAGDLVLSHSGRWRKVTAIMQRPYADDIVVLRTYGRYDELRLTPNHPVRVVDPTTQVYSWVPAGDLTGKEFLVMPRRKTGDKLIGEKLAELIAWYIAEGSAAKTAVQFTVGYHETEYAERIVACADGAPSRHYETPPTRNVVLHSAQLADFLAAHCGIGALNKRIPLDLIAGHEQLVLDTLIDGDGCRRLERDVFTTISEQLANDVQMLAHSLGMTAAIQLRASSYSTIDGREIFGQPSYNVDIRRPKRATYLRPAKHGIATRIQRIHRELYMGEVFNFSVGIEESYIANGLAVHNCSFDSPFEGAIWGDDMRRIATEGGICDVPWNPQKPVETWLDLGFNDPGAVWFLQYYDGERHFIDYHQQSNWSTLDWARFILNKPYTYTRHIAPWDAAHHNPDTGKVRAAFAAEVGLRYTIAKKPANIGDQIEAARAYMRRYKCRFDQTRCRQGIDALSQYRWKKDRAGNPTTEVVKTDLEHGAAAFRTGVTMDRDPTELFRPRQVIAMSDYDVLRGVTERDILGERRQAIAISEEGGPYEQSVWWT